MESIDDVMRDKERDGLGMCSCVQSDGDSWISKCRELPKVEGDGKVGRPPKSWKEVLKKDFRQLFQSERRFAILG